MPQRSYDIPERSYDIPERSSDIPEGSSDIPEGSSDIPKYLKKKEVNMERHDYVPINDLAFQTWLGNVLDYSDTNKTRLDIDAERITALRAKAALFSTALAKLADPNHGPVDTQRKNEARKDIEKDIRAFVQEKITYNSNATDDDRRNMATPIHDKTPTPHPAPDTVPDVEIVLPYPRTVHIKFRSETMARGGKPAYVHGIECLWVIADAPPAKIGELLHSAFATKNPLELTFDEDQRGQRVYFAVRWESGTVKKGPWSDIFSVVIP
ncbi:hypothetical protein PilKf_00328 [Pillotina sp. SPG140]|jgi:hypothetical protein